MKEAREQHFLHFSLVRNPRGVGGVGGVGGWGRSLTPHTPHTPHTPLPTLCVRNPGLLYETLRLLPPVPWSLSVAVGEASRREVLPSAFCISRSKQS
ncbi:MAG: hypothetical protein V7K77_31825 [Nostoc sp.]|uniref:hypothetical protein n=1 Tax=Nostoc sp. TaxID=1180 RepID=UPI002FF69BA2